MQQKYQEKEKSPSGFFAVAISSIFPYRSPPPTLVQAQFGGDKNVKILSLGCSSDNL